MNLPRLLLLTDRTQLPAGRHLTDTVAACVRAGVTHVVLREVDLAADERAAILARLSAAGALVITAHEPLHGCVGVHLRSVVSRLGAGAPHTSTTELLVGRSCHTREEVRRAAAEGAAYATLSPYAVSRSKPGHGPPLPAEEFADHPIPVLALGGVDPSNAARAREAGAHGVAVMGAVMRAEDPGATVRVLIEAVR